MFLYLGLLIFRCKNTKKIFFDNKKQNFFNVFEQNLLSLHHYL